MARNCRKATLLMEKERAGRITIREQLELKVHLAGCSGCRLFEQQSIVIDQLVCELFNESQLSGDSTLDEDFKKKIQHQIIERIKEK